MANELLAGLAGLVGGVERGLQGREVRAGAALDRQGKEKERAFRLKQFEEETRRAAMLDSLNEEVARGRLALQEKATKLEEDRLDIAKRNAEEIPVTVGDRTFNIPREALARIREMEAQMEIQKSNMVPLSTGGFGSPEFLANLSRLTSEQQTRRKDEIKTQLSRLVENRVSQGVPFEQAQQEALRLGALFYPEEFAGIDLTQFGINPEATVDEVNPSERGAGLLDRAAFGGTALGFMSPQSAAGGVARPGLGGAMLQNLGQAEGDPIEALRNMMFGPEPPQTLEELQASREQRRSLDTGISLRNLELINSVGGLGQ